MTNKTYEIRNNDTDMWYVAPDGMIFMSRDEYIDYMRGLNN